MGSSRGTVFGWGQSTTKIFDLLAALRQALEAGQIERFKELVLSAVRGWGYEVIESSRAAPQPVFDEWVAETAPVEGHVEPEMTPRPLRVHDPASTERHSYWAPAIPTPEAIEKAAYHLWEQHGRPNGLDQHFWHQARNELARNGFLRKAE